MDNLDDTDKLCGWTWERDGVQRVCALPCGHKGFHSHTAQVINGSTVDWNRNEPHQLALHERFRNIRNRMLRQRNNG